MTDFRINVIVDPTRAKAGAAVVRRDLQRVESQANSLRASLVRAFAVVGAGAVIGGSLRLLAQFSQEMSTVRAVAQATDEQFRQLSETARTLGATTRFSAVEAAEGMTFLARAGFNANEVLASIGDTLLLAQAGALGLGSAADIASNVLKGFQLDIDQTSRVVDVLALAANSANTTVFQLGDAMKKVAPIAQGLGVDLETATAAVAALSDAGIQGQSAGAGLVQVLAKLQAPSAELTKLLDDVNLSTQDVSVSQNGLATALRNVGKAVSAEDALAVFGVRGGPAFQVLRQAVGDVEEMADALRDADGTAARIAATMDDNLNGALLALRSAFQGLILEIGESGATGSLRGFVDTLTAVLRGMTENIDRVISSLQTLITLLAIRFAKQAVPAAVRAMRVFIATLATNPLGLLITGLTIAISLLVGFGDEIGIAGDSAATFEDVFVVAAQKVGDAFQSLVDFFAGGVLGSAVAMAFGDIDLSIRGTLIALGAFADNLIGVFTGAFNAVGAIWDRLPEVFTSIGELSLKAIRDIAEGTLDVILAVLQTIGDLIRVTASELGNIVAASAGAAGALAAGNLDAAASQAESAENAAKLIVAAFATIPERVRGNFAALGKADLLPVIELTEQAGVTGEAIAEAFVEGFQTTVGSDFVSDVLVGAEDRAAQRILDAQQGAFDKARQDAATPPSAGGGPGTGAVPGGIDLSATAEANVAFQSILDRLQEEAVLLQLTGAERERAIEIRRVEQELRKEGLELTSAEREQVEVQIAFNQGLANQAALLEQIRGPQQQFNDQLAAAKALLEADKITAEEFGVVLQDLTLQAAEAGTSIADGLTRGFIKIQQSAEDLAATAENVLGTAFDSAGSALERFVQTGEFNFKQFASSLLLDIASILGKQGLAGLASALGGAGGGDSGASTASSIVGILASLFGGAAEHGARVNPNQAFLVGEGGPELFVPPGNGNVISNDETMKALGGGGGNAPIIIQSPAAPAVVQITNVTDSSQIIEALNTSEAEQAILNVIDNNPDRVKRSQS